VLSQEQEMLRWVSSWITPTNPTVFCLAVKRGPQCSSNSMGTTPGKLPGELSTD